MVGKKSTIIIAVSSILFLLIYSILAFAMKLSYSTYGAVHVVFALIVVIILSKIIAVKESSFKIGLIISLIVGILLLIPNFLIHNMNQKLAGTNMVSMFNAPNPIIFFILLIIIFNIPFLLFSRISIGKTTIFSVILIVLILVTSPIYSLTKLGCVSFSCNEDGCFCKYTSVISEGECPQCSSFCAEKGKTEAKTTLPLSNMPVSIQKTVDGEFQATGGPVQCYCYCK
jgi:hypothetical protein|tara:strand:+ start:928 stop:1611 length:684 start_codon:yes stop_codon:yes gene_type:complete